MQYIRGEYCFYLNLDDLHNPELPLIKNRSAGGTLCFWKKQLDPYVTVISVKTQSFLPVILKLTNFQISVHIALYLPTHGKDTKFISDLAELGICIEELTNSYPEAVFYIRGDGNVNSKNVNRVALLEHFLEKFYLTKVIVPLPTYPTFVGNGMFDSNIDIILQTSSLSAPESVSSILCKKNHPHILSHHDVIVSDFSLPAKPMQQTKEKLIKAPRVNLKREKIIWTAEAAIKYERIIAPHLRRLRENWLCPSSQSSMSILLETTNILLQKTASSTNKSKSLGNKPVAKSTKTPKPILKAQKQLSKFGKFCMKGKEAELRSAKANYRRTVRRTGVKNDCEHDMKLDQIMGDNPDSAYSFISYCRRTAQVSLDKLTVGDKVYDGADVPDGFYDSMSMSRPG